MQSLMLRLQAIGGIQFGSFALKKDFMAPFLVDLRGVISHPQIAKEICDVLWNKAQHLHFDVICGTPLVGQALATYLAWSQDIPLVMRRMHVKESEMRPSIEGIYKTGQRCLVIDDFMLSGSGLLDTVEALGDEGLEVRDTLSLIDLELGGRKKIKLHSISPHCVFSLSSFLQTLFDSGKIPGDTYKLIGDFLEQQQSNGKKSQSHS